MARDRNRNNKIVKRALSRRKGYKLNNPTSYLNTKPNEKRKLSPIGTKKSNRSKKLNFNLVEKGFSPGKQSKDRHPKQIMHPLPYSEIENLYPGTFEEGGRQEGVMTPATNDTRNHPWWHLENGDGGECKFRCNGQDIWVAPGDCVRCPENSYCPDNWECSVMPRGNQDTSMDLGFACCGCAAAYTDSVDPDGPNANSGGIYGKKLGWTFTMWSGDNDCDDGRWLQAYYGSRRQNVYTNENDWRDNNATNDDWTFNNDNFWSGPWNYNTDQGFDGLGANYFLHRMFYWADDQPFGNQQYYPQGTMGEIIVDGVTYDVDLSLVGSGYGHMACAEWGYDCGDVLQKCPPGSNRSRCQRLFEASAQEIWNHPDYAALTFGHETDPSHPDCDYGPSAHLDKRKTFLGYDAGEYGPINDPNMHCGWTINRGGTCKNKCNRPKYLSNALPDGSINPYFIPHPDYPTDSLIGWDPGGLAFKSGTPGGSPSDDGWSPTGPDSCFCDYQCYHCGCDYETFLKSNDEDQARTLYDYCLRSCAGDCYGPNHVADGFDETYIPAGSGQNDTVKIGSRPGLDCNLNSNIPPGDCCDDWRSECYIQKSKLPCECYDIKDNQNENGIEETLVCDGPDCEFDWSNQFSIQACPDWVSGTNWCTHWFSFDAESSNQCSIACNQSCNGKGYSQSGVAFDSSLTIQNASNRTCIMEWFNENILGLTEYEKFTQTPSCTTSMADSDYDSGSCKCACKCNEYNTIFGGENNAPNRVGGLPEEADVGCGGFLPEGLSEQQLCNYDGVDSKSYNCSVEYIESLNDSWYSSFITSDQLSRRCTLTSSSNYASDPYTVGDSYDGIIPKRVVQLYTLIQAYNESPTCDDNYYYYDEMLNGFKESCNEGWQKYLEWWSGFEKGCKGCADPTAGNYTGNVIKNSVGLPMDCSGDGTAPASGAGDTECCYYETGCNDVAALNYLTSAEAENESNVPTGGLGSLDPELQDNQVIPLTSTRFCEILTNIFGGEEGYQGSCVEAGYHHNNPPVVVDGQDEYVYCFAPQGCANFGEEDFYCSYDTIDYCNVNTACNYSLSCSSGTGHHNNSCGALGQQSGWTCVGDTAVMCGEAVAGLCINSAGTGKVNFCADSDGDCLTDVDEDGVELNPQAIGCDMSGIAFMPKDAETYFESNAFANQNGLSGYEILYGNIYCDGGYLNGPEENGYPLVKCDVATESDFGLVNCPTNMTHADQGDGRNCTGIGNVPASYPSYLGDGPSPKPWHGTTFDITDCCIQSDYCNNSSGVNGGVVNNVQLPCCYRDDDCGNCNLPNKGIFVKTIGGIPQDGTEPEPFPNADGGNYGCSLPNVGGGWGIWDYTDSAFGIARGTAWMYHTDTPNTSFCSCDVVSVLGCNCNNPDDNDAGTVCVANPLEFDCSSVCGGDSGADDCGVCNGPGHIESEYSEGNPTCCPENSPNCTDEFGNPNDNPQCGVPDCNFVCGGNSEFENFSLDGDEDGFCINEIYPYCTADVVNDRPGDYYVLTVDCSGIDDDDEIPCSTNNIDDCDQCVGVEVDEFNESQDCHGVCFGSNQLDECGICACPPGLENNCGVDYNTWNSTQDQCGICQGDTLMSKDILGFDVELTWGSFGCEQRDWYGDNFDSSDQSGGTCGPRAEGGNGILHCGCQCAGCTNMASPAWTPHAKYPESEDTTIDWMYGDPIWVLLTGNDYSSENFCWNQLNFELYEQAKEVIDTVYDRFGSYCSELAIETAINYAGSNEAYKYCMFFDGELCLSGDEISTCDTPGSVSFQEFFENVIPSKGWYWHGNLNWIHCSNPNPGSHCPGGDTQCIDNYGQRCCGQWGSQEDYHCRSGIRSELYWTVSRGDDGYEFPDWSFGQGGGTGDVNNDGIVNILDIVTTVQYVLGNINLTPQQILAADINGDGIVNILDIVSMLNQILSIMSNGGLVSNKNSLNSMEQDSLMRNLKPLFNNSIYTNMNLTDNHGQRLKNSNSRETQTRTTYNFDYFSFLLNAPICIPSDVDVEIGQAFGGWSDIEVVPMGNGLMSVGVVSNNQGSVSVSIGEGAKPLFIVYHPNVHIQADEQYKQVGTTTPNNMIKYIPAGTTSTCTSLDPLNQEHAQVCVEIMDLSICNESEICEVQYLSGENTIPYESKGIFGYDFETWNPFTNCVAGGCPDTKQFWLPGEREELLPTEPSCDY